MALGALHRLPDATDVGRMYELEAGKVVGKGRQVVGGALRHDTVAAIAVSRYLLAGVRLEIAGVTSEAPVVDEVAEVVGAGPVIGLLFREEVVDVDPL
jgi:hypothetical protein